MIYISTFIVPTIIVFTVAVGLIEKKDIFNIFCEGAKEGTKIMFSMFPTLIGIFLAISMLRSSELLDFLAEKLQYITKGFGIPNEILPLMFIKPVSGSASMAFATDLMTKYGVDSKIGMLAGTIISSSETTFYVIAVYLSSVKIKGSGRVVVPALVADITCMLVALAIFRSWV